MRRNPSCTGVIASLQPCASIRSACTKIYPRWHSGGAPQRDNDSSDDEEEFDGEIEDANIRYALHYLICLFSDATLKSFCFADAKAHSKYAR
jgi:hypothetical protein